MSLQTSDTFSIKIDKSKWCIAKKGVDKKGALKVELEVFKTNLISLFKEFREQTGCTEISRFLNLTFELVGGCSKLYKHGDFYIELDDWNNNCAIIHKDWLFVKALESEFLGE